MKKIFTTFLMMLSLTACAGMDFRLTKKYKGIDPEFETYITEFIYLSKGKVSDNHFKGFTMGFRTYPKDSTTVGTCHYSVNEVDISKEWWKDWNRSYSERIELIFHELGHCILKRGHSNKPGGVDFWRWLERLGFDLGIFKNIIGLFDGCPGSFMHPETISELCINKHFYYYIQELFNHTPKTYVQPIEEEDKKHCSEPEVINKTSTWTKRDEDTLNRSKNKCVAEYKSCLKKFTKKSEDNYNVICE